MELSQKCLSDNQIIDLINLYGINMVIIELFQDEKENSIIFVNCYDYLRKPYKIFICSDKEYREKYKESNFGYNKIVKFNIYDYCLENNNYTTLLYIVENYKNEFREFIMSENNIDFEEFIEKYHFPYNRSTFDSLLSGIKTYYANEENNNMTIFSILNEMIKYEDLSICSLRGVLDYEDLRGVEFPVFCLNILSELFSYSKQYNIAISSEQHKIIFAIINKIIDFNAKVYGSKENFLIEIIAGTMYNDENVRCDVLLYSNYECARYSIVLTWVIYSIGLTKSQKVITENRNLINLKHREKIMRDEDSERFYINWTLDYIEKVNIKSSDILSMIILLSDDYFIIV